MRALIQISEPHARIREAASYDEAVKAAESGPIDIAFLDIDLKQHIHSLEQAKASDKIMHAFHFLARRFGEKLDNANVKMLLPLTQQDLANFLGLTRETTGAQLKDLQQKGVITYQQQQYIVHTDRLRAALES